MTSIEYTQFNSRQLILSSRFIESWFPLRYSLDVYSGCEYSCPFCRVNWQIKKKVIVKKNIIALLKRELSLLEEALNPALKTTALGKNRNSFNKILMGVGGGFNEVFSPINQREKHSDEVIRELVRREHLPLVMTQNPGYFLERMSEVKGVILVVSFINSELGLNEENKLTIPSQKDKLKAMEKLVANGVTVGGLVMPIIPMVKDTAEELKPLFGSIKQTGVSFILFDTIDFEGLQHLNNEDFKLKPFIEPYIFQGEHNQYQASNNFKKYQRTKRSEINRLLVDLKIFPQVPLTLIRKYLSSKDQACVALGQMFYMEKMHYDYVSEKSDSSGITIKTAYKFASYSLNQITEEKYDFLLKEDLWKSLSGVGDYLSLLIGQMARGDFSAYDEKLASLWASPKD